MCRTLSALLLFKHQIDSMRHDCVRHRELSSDISRSAASRRAWLDWAVFAIDRLLRRRFGVYEYSSHPRCLFRIQIAWVEDTLVLPDGSRIVPGRRVLGLHLWNERVPLMGHSGPTMGWARRFTHAIQLSLDELACYLAGEPDLSDIAGICLDIRVSDSEHAEQFARVFNHYGFEADTAQVDRRGMLHRLGDAVLVLMLLSVTNPVGLRRAIFRTGNQRLFLARATLEKRYGAVRPRYSSIAPAALPHSAGPEDTYGELPVVSSAASAEVAG